MPQSNTAPIALALHFPAERLNDGAGDPYWVDFTLEEARRLHAQLAESRAAGDLGGKATEPASFTLA